MHTSDIKCSTTGATSIFAPIVRKGFGFISKSTVIFFLKIIVAVILLVVIASQIQLRKLTGIYAAADQLYLFIAFVLILPNILIQIIKWHYLLRLTNPDISFAIAVKSVMVGFPLGFMTPGRLGEIGRAFFIERLPTKQAVKLVVIDKVSNNIIVLVIGLMCISASRQLDLGSNARVLIAVISFMLLALLIAAFSSRSINWIKRFINVPEPGRRNVLVILLLAAIFYAIFTGQFMLLVLSFAQLDLNNLFQAVAAVFCIKTLLPVAIGDLGIREGASVFFITKIGGSKEIAFNAALLIFCFNSILPTLCGLPMIFKLKRKS